MLFLFLFLFGLALGTESPSGEHPFKLEQGNCSQYWSTFNNRCYKYISADMNWADAELYCVSQKANLVSIHSLEEQKFVKYLISQTNHAEGFTWIGLSDVHHEGRWVWSDGSAVDKVFWKEGEPSNGEGHENCVHTNYVITKEWNDIICSNKYPFVCATRTVCP